MSGVVLRPAGDRAALLDVADVTEATTVAKRLRLECPQLVDIVPGHCTVLVTWAKDVPRDLEPIALRALAGEAGSLSPATHSIPVAYEGPDLAAVAALANLSIEAVAALHQESLYTVGFIGFAPGFAYLVDGDPRLHVPRRDVPRTHVPAGSVALAGVYSGVYPRESPGGWHLIGRTSFVLFDPARAEPATLSPGDLVRFTAE